jgi:Zn-dependent protease with chaperone function
MTLLPLELLAPVIFALAAALLAALVYPPLRPHLLRCAPETRRSLLLGLAFAPLIAAVGLTLVAFLPSLVGFFWPELDHCTVHGPADHPHLCLQHPPEGNTSAMGLLLAGAVFGVLAFFGARQLVRLFAASSLMRRLRRVARREAALGASVFETQAPLAITSGIFSHTIYLSTGLVHALPPEQLEVVLAHERHHADRHDPFWRSLAAAASGLHLPWARRQILSDLHLACEQACDEAAARSTRDRALVAHTVLAVTRLLEDAGRNTPHLLSGFGGQHVLARVESLVAEEARPARWSRGWAMALVAVLILWLAEPLHHGIETLLGAFVGG